MLERLLAYLHNWFIRERTTGDFTIADGHFTLPFLLNGQYFRILGSALNDGLYIYGDTIKDGDGNDTELQDEAFNGAVWALGIPKGVITLAKDISDWEAKYGDAVASPYTSESFGGYAYSKAGAGSAQNGGAGGWENAFAARLDQYRKLPGCY